jgi:putative colanic acid biosynthesis acetyltransferase WcaF
MQPEGKTDLASFNNDWYSPGAGKLKILFWGVIKPIFFLNYLNPLSRLKVFLLRMFGAKIGKCVVIKQGVNVKNPWLLEVGDHVWIGERVWIENLAKVTIGSNACLSQGAMIMTGNHNYKKSTFDLMVAPVTLEDGVWIGAKATVCPGVVCHSHSVLSMHSVTSKDLDAYTIYSGNPAVKVRERIIEK